MRKLLMGAILGAVVALTFATTAEAWWCRWVPGHRDMHGRWVQGHKICGPGRGWDYRYRHHCRWVPPHRNMNGVFVQGHNVCW